MQHMVPKYHCFTTKDPVFSSRKKGYLMSVSLVREERSFKNENSAEKARCHFFFFLFLKTFSQTITNFGSDDILILSLWVCETTPSVCFPLIRVIATNITATVPHDKLLHANVWRLFRVWSAQVSSCPDVTEQQACILITIREPAIYLTWHCSHVINHSCNVVKLKFLLTWSVYF